MMSDDPVLFRLKVDACRRLADLFEEAERKALTIERPGPCRRVLMPDKRGADFEAVSPSPCRRCKIRYRLVGIEGTDKPHHDLYTFECPRCGHITTLTVRIQ
jgi:hypothetical protein